MMKKKKKKLLIFLYFLKSLLWISFTKIFIKKDTFYTFLFLLFHDQLTSQFSFFFISLFSYFIFLFLWLSFLTKQWNLANAVLKGLGKMAHLEMVVRERVGGDVGTVIVWIRQMTFFSIFLWLFFIFKRMRKRERNWDVWV